MKKIIFTLLFLLTTFTLFSCSNEEITTKKTDELYISSSNNIYYLDKENNITFTVDVSKSLLSEHNKDNIAFYIDGTNTIEALIIGTTFKASKEGSVIVKGKIGDLSSSNSITITVDYSEEYKNAVNNEEEVIKRFNALTDEVFVLGKTYDLGIQKEYASNYHIEGADEIFEINSDGKLEVCGIAYGKMSLVSNLTNKKLSSQINYNVSGGSVFARTIKDDLICNKTIRELSDPIKKSMLENIKTLDLSTIIINDPDCIDGIKYLTNIEELDLSDNEIDNINFASSINNLKKLIIRNNNIVDVSSIINHEGIEYLDISNNNISDITKIQHLHYLKYLDLSNNNINNISYLTSLYDLRSLFLNNNKLSSFSDNLASLSKLEELGISHCNIAFNDIISLKFIENFTYLDISGTDCNLSVISKYNKLKTLKLSDCHLDEKDISLLNDLVNIESLDISDNMLDIANSTTMNGFKLNGARLSKLKELYLGGNEYVNLPNLSAFTSLVKLDLSNSYNLESLNSLGNLGIEELNIDFANSIEIGTNGNDFISAISKEKLPNLKKLSIQSGLNYMTLDLYNKIKDKILNEELAVRFLDDDYVDFETIYNYNSIVYFDLNSLLKMAQQMADNSYLLPESQPHIILSLVNDNDYGNNDNIVTINIPRQVYKFEIYGNKYKSYNINFNVLDRKEKSLRLKIHNFVDEININKPFLKAEDGSKLIIEGDGISVIKGKSAVENAVAMISCYDININYSKYPNSLLTIQGFNGVDGKDGRDADTSDVSIKNATSASSGGTAIKCHNIIINECNISISGGDGGNGGNGGNSTAGWFASLDSYRCGGNGGDGGDGGDGIECTSYQVFEQLRIKGGNGGTAGKGGVASAGLVPGPDGKDGNPGQSGEPIIVKQ